MGRRLIPLILAAGLFLTGCDDLTQVLEESILKSNDLFGNLVTVTSDTGGTLVKPETAEERYEDGVAIPLEVTLDSAYSFDTWVKTAGEGTVSFDNADSASTTATVTGGDATINASLIPATYTLTVSVSSASQGAITTPSTSTVTVTHGVARSIVATNPYNRGYYFSGWTQIAGSGTATFADASSRSTTVTVTDGDATIRANYALISVSLAVQSTYNLNDSGLNTSERLTTANDITVVGNYAYVVGQDPAGAARMLKLDISNLTNISHNASLSLGYSSEIRDIHYESPYITLAVSGTYGDLYRFNPSTGFTVSDLGMNTSLYKTAGSSYVSTSSSDLNYYSSHAAWSYFDSMHALLYDPNYNRVYAAGYFDMGSGELYSFRHQSNETFLEVATAFSMDDTGLGYYFSDLAINDIYLYSAIGSGGILTLNVDDDPYAIENRASHTSLTGDPAYISLGGVSSNYLVALSDEFSVSYNDRLAVYDIHWNNNSDNNPYFINGRNLQYGNPKALFVSDNTIFSIEGTYLVIYQMTPNTN
ncbi:MAG: hypothetical protein JXA95_14695 [Spirochaetales bacterium]|nr:hypothetical protein [Spirochaetales bacterium]